MSVEIKIKDKSHKIKVTYRRHFKKERETIQLTIDYRLLSGEGRAVSKVLIFTLIDP